MLRGTDYVYGQTLWDGKKIPKYKRPLQQMSNIQCHVTTFYTFFDQPSSISATVYIFMQYVQLDEK